MYSIAGVILLALLFALVRRRTRSPSCVIEETGFGPPDLTSDQTIATDMPDSEWLRIAREYLANGEVRLAVRAMYLANLAYLGARQLISIQQSKSNGIYERELKARVRVGVLAAAFAAANRIYERVWYGFHEVTPDLVEDFERTMEVIRRAEA
jgi:Domain of unknown function (DUF4129)